LKVLLFDPLLESHHLEFVEHTARYLIEQGDVVTFVAWSPDPRLRALRERVPDLDLRFVMKEPESFGGSRGRYYTQMLRAVDRALSIAGARNVDVFHHLFLEKSEVQLRMALSVHHRPRRVFGTFFWPYFIHAESDPGLLVRTVHGANRLALRQMLSSGALDGLFVDSTRVRDQLVAALGGRVREDRILVLPEPAVAPSGSREDARTWLGVPEGVPVLLFLGLLSQRKGADILLDALPFLDADEDWRVVMAGTPETVGEPEVERCRSRLAHPERLIARLGFVPDEDVDRYFLAADAVVLPYRRSHLGTSGIVGRAAAAGKPVIVSDVGDIGPTVREHGLGLVVEPEDPQALADAIRGFLDDRVRLTADTAPRSRAYAEASDWRAFGEGVRARYLA
jgi:glycosyltransferase involved in cell wall biosynthesis